MRADLPSVKFYAPQMLFLQRTLTVGVNFVKLFNDCTV